MPHKERISIEEKVKAVEEYLAGNCSQSDICVKYDISGRHLLDKRVPRWIIKMEESGYYKTMNNGCGTCG